MALIAGLVVALAFSSGASPANGQTTGGAGTMSIDTVIDGNTPSAIGTIEPCVGNVAPGSTVTFDVTAQDIPAYDNNGTPVDPADDRGGIIAYAFNLSYNPAVMSVTASTINSSEVNLLLRNAGSSIFEAGDPLPNTGGSYSASVLDTGVSVPESGSGVLERITITVGSSAPAGQYSLIIDPANAVHLDATGVAIVPQSVHHGAIAVAQPCGPIATLPPTPSPAPSQRRLSPTDDVYVAAEPPFSRWNYGRATDLRSDGSPVRETYLRFDLGWFAGETIQSARLRMFVTNGSVDVHYVKTLSDGHPWDEESLYWTNRPPKESTAAYFVPGPATGVWIEVDVTEVVAARAGRGLSLAIDTADADAFHFNSREAAENGVELVVEYGGASPPTPGPTPTPGPPETSGVAFAGSATAVNSAASPSLAIPRPAGTTPGDLLVASVAVNGASVLTAPAGWTEIAAIKSATNPKLFAYSHIAGSNEPDNYSWSLTSAAMSSGGIANYRGADPTNPIDTQVRTASSSAIVPSLTVPAITDLSPGAMLIGAAAINSSKSTVVISGPPALIERWELEGKRQEYGDGLPASSGNSGVQTWTFSAPRAAAAWLAALRPAP
jgi:hypothetical protein